ncbi:MAG: DUF1351 domain-containing protein [Anaerovoracaceae bacterium]
MSELKLSIQQSPGAIQANFEEIEAQLKEKMKEYKGAVFTEETKDIAKSEIASLRKLSKAMDERRIEVKKVCLEPYFGFEEKAKTLIALIDEPIELIDKQLKEFEKNRIAEKKIKITEIYAKSVCGVEEYIPFEKIYNKKWENVTTSIKSIEKDIGNIAESVRTAIDTIQGMNSDAVPKALEMYKKTLSLTDAITYINNFETQKQEIIRKEAARKKEEEERARAKEIECVRAEERRRVAEEDKIREKARIDAENERIHVDNEPEEVVREADVPVEQFDNLPFETPSTITVRYRVVALPHEIDELDTLMNSIGICFEKERID